MIVMTRKLLSFALALCMLVSLLPAVSFATEEVQDDFLLPVEQITEEDTLPAGYLPIYTEDDLAMIEDDPSGKYILMEDIEIAGQKWSSLCYDSKPFTGILEGNGHTISGIKESEWSGPEMNWGLFEAIDGARISNLKVTGAFAVSVSSMGYTSCDFYLGGLAGQATGNIYITNCVCDVSFDVPAKSTYVTTRVGGLIGYYDGNHDDCVIRDCRNLATINAYEYAGGLVGEFDLNVGSLTLFNCRNEADVTSADGRLMAGGIAGYLHGKKGSSVEVEACLNTGNISGEYAVGGIFGSMSCYISSNAVDSELNISSCVNTGNITGTKDVGGITGRIMGNIRDSLNSGNVYVDTIYETVDCGGITGELYCGTVTRCVNVGSVTGKTYNNAIATPWVIFQTEAEAIAEAESEADAMIVDCYWLGNGLTNTLYNACFWSMGEVEGTRQYRTRGMLTAEEMAQEESFVNFSFPDIWTMDEELGYPYPTALLNACLVDTYKAEYIRQTNGFVNGSYYLETLMGGSGDGSFAGILGDYYEKAKLDKVNGVWEGMNSVSDMLEYKIPTKTNYDYLLADLLGGAVSRNIREDHILSNTMSTISTFLTKANFTLSEGNVKLVKELLKKAAGAVKLDDEIIKEVLDITETVGLKTTSFTKFGNFLGDVNSIVSIADAAASGCENVWDAFQFYVLCNANAMTVTTYGDLFLDVAKQAKKISSTEGGELYKSTQEFVNTINSNLENEPTSLFDKGGRSIANLLTVGGGSILEKALQLTKLNPVVEFLSLAKSGYVLGVNAGNELTSMDDIAYYGHMMGMCEIFAKALHAEVLERQAAFAKSQTYEDAQALNLASDLYINVQIQACDYAYGYCNAIASSALSKLTNTNKDDFEAGVDVMLLKYELIALRDNSQNIFVGADGSLNGFLANCPVTVEVTASDGTLITRMETDNITTAEAYEGTYLLLGDENQHKAGMYDPKEHTVTITGEADGTMDLVVYHTEEGQVTRIDTYLDVEIREGEQYVITDTGLTGETTVLPTKTENVGEESTEPDEEPNEEPEESGEVQRLAGSDRFTTAFLVADQMKVNLGIDAFDSVIVASGTNFADALSGSYLAAVKNAPILLSFSGSSKQAKTYNQMVQDYILNNLTPGGTVYILGGPSAVPEYMEDGLESFQVKRLAGADRFGTNLAILEEAGVGDKDILVCTGLSFADSLSASASKMPILLVWNKLTDAQVEFLSGLNGNNLYIIGGESAVSMDMQKQVGKYGPVDRIGGSNRFETSVLIAEWFFDDPDSAVLAYAWNYPDGLCGGALAATMDAPLILTMTKYETQAAEYIQGHNITTGTVLGGTGLISDKSVELIFPQKTSNDTGNKYEDELPIG